HAEKREPFDSKTSPKRASCFEDRKGNLARCSRPRLSSEFLSALHDFCTVATMVREAGRVRIMQSFVSQPYWPMLDRLEDSSSHASPYRSPTPLHVIVVNDQDGERLHHSESWSIPARRAHMASRANDLASTFPNRFNL